MGQQQYRQQEISGGGVDSSTDYHTLFYHHCNDHKKNVWQNSRKRGSDRPSVKWRI